MTGAHSDKRKSRRETEYAQRSTRKPLRHRAPPGAAPGTMVPDPDAPRPVVRLVGYSPENIHEETLAQTSDIVPFMRHWPMVWINVDGLGDVDLIRELGEIFNLHSLVLEDIINVYQRPKVEDYGEYLFVVTRMIQPGSPLDTEQVSLLLGNNYVLTFQERLGDSFDPVRQRLRRGGQIRARGSGYLAYALLDASLDAYFPVLEELTDHVESLQQEILNNSARDVMKRIHQINRDLITLRRAVWPQREMIGWLSREAETFIQDVTKTYLRDTYDHCVQLIDLTETARDLIRGLTDLSMTTEMSRTNEIMRVLTMVATIFIPLGFIASVYGMNFDPDVSPFNMPEINWRFGYPYALALMTAVGAGLLWQFRRRGWIHRAGAKKFEQHPHTQREDKET